MGLIASAPTESAVEPAALRDGPAEVAGPPFRPGPYPGWLRVTRAVHESGPGPAAALADAVALALVGLALHVRAEVTAGFALLTPVILYIGRHYVRRSTLATQGVFWYPSQVLVGYSVASVALLAATNPLPMHPPTALLAAAGFGALVTLRGVTWGILSTARRGGAGLVPTAVLGGGEPAKRVVARLRECPEAGLLPTMVLDPVWSETGAARQWDPEEAAVALRSGEIRQLIVIPDGNPEQELREYLGHVDDLDVALLPPLEDLFLAPGRRVCRVGGLPLLSLGRWSGPETPRPGKRAFDVLVTTLLLVLLSPVLLAAAVAVRASGGGPVIYRQRRVGYHGRVFEIWKFRTMTDGADRLLIDLSDRNSADGLLFKVRDDPRVTPVGRVLRRLSIDELPQLFNVLRGQMSLVGPRPLAVDPDVFGEQEQRRHTVLPGMTGYWQVAGGNGLTYQEMIKLDLAYVHGWSLWLDVMLLVQTIPALIRRRGPW